MLLVASLGSPVLRAAPVGRLVSVYPCYAVYVQRFGLGKHAFLRVSGELFSHVFPPVTNDLTISSL